MNGNTQSVSPSVDFEKFKVIEGIDFSMIKQKLQAPKKSHGKAWGDEKATKAIDLYKKWLYLRMADPTAKNVPTVLIDDVWHQHILDTHAYEQDCKKVFGYFLHHFPYFGMRGDEDRAKLEAAFLETKLRFKAVWGHAMGTKMRAAMCDGSGSQCEAHCDTGGGGGMGNCEST